MKRIALLGCLAGFLFANSAVADPPATEGFPFFRSFMDDNLDQIDFPLPHPSNVATATRSNSAALGTGTYQDQGLVLTTGVSQVGAFYLPGHPFTTQDGMLIEFEYAMIGPTNQLTDGITMFLVDADPAFIGSNMKFGAEGSGFGYTHRLARSGTQLRADISGIRGGYLAVALDQGPFKTRRMEGEEMRSGIVYSNSGGLGEVGAGFDTRSNVTIRGAGGQESKKIDKWTVPEYHWGYPVLISRETMGNSAGFKLNPSTGLFETQLQPTISTPFNISGGALFSNPGQAQYRKATIALEPNPDANGGGFKVTVTIQHGSEESVVIKDFTYTETVTYIENGLPREIQADGFPIPYHNAPLATYTVETPEKLVVGFSGSTGYRTAYTNIIKNLRITTLYGAEANDDYVNHRRGPVTIKPLENDKGYKQSGTNPTADKDNIDPMSLRLWIDEYNRLPDGQYEYEIADKGKWVYDPNAAELMFFPKEGYKGEVSIMYDVKAKGPDYNDEKYRSSLATVRVTIADNQP